MDWDDLRYFAELARTGSLSAAARSLKVDHSTVARRVSSLEENLGIRLFDRLPRGWTLTPAGKGVADRVSGLEEEVFAVTSFARGQSGELTGTVRVTAPPAFAALFLMPRLGLLRERHPNIELELAGEMRVANLTRREADLAVRIGRPEGASMVARRLPDYMYGLYGSKSYIEATPPAERVLMGMDESLEQTSQQRWLRRYAGGKPLSIRSNDMVGLLSAVRAGLGVAILPRFMGDPVPDLLCVEAGDELLCLQMWLVVHGDVRRSPSVRAVMDMIVEITDRDRTVLEGRT